MADENKDTTESGLFIDGVDLDKFGTDTTESGLHIDGVDLDKFGTDKASPESSSFPLPDPSAAGQSGYYDLRQKSISGTSPLSLPSESPLIGQKENLPYGIEKGPEGLQNASQKKSIERTKKIEQTIRNQAMEGNPVFKDQKTREMYYDALAKRGYDRATVKQIGDNSIAVAPKYKELTEAVNNDPSDTKSAYELGMMQMATRDFGSAVSIFSKLLAQSPDNNEYKHAMAFALQNAGDEKGAQAIMGEIPENYWMPESEHSLPREHTTDEKGFPITPDAKPGTYDTPESMKMKGIADAIDATMGQVMGGSQVGMVEGALFGTDDPNTGKHHQGSIRQFLEGALEITAPGTPMQKLTGLAKGAAGAMHTAFSAMMTGTPGGYMWSTYPTVLGTLSGTENAQEWFFAPVSKGLNKAGVKIEEGSAAQYGLEMLDVAVNLAILKYGIEHPLSKMAREPYKEYQNRKAAKMIDVRDQIEKLMEEATEEEIAEAYDMSKAKEEIEDVPGGDPKKPKGPDDPDGLPPVSGGAKMLIPEVPKEKVQGMKNYTPDSPISQISEMTSVEHNGESGVIMRDPDTNEIIFRTKSGKETVIAGGGSSQTASELGVSLNEGFFSDKHGDYYVVKGESGYNVYRIGSDGSLTPAYVGDKANVSRRDSIIKKALDVDLAKKRQEAEAKRQSAQAPISEQAKVAEQRKRDLPQGDTRDESQRKKDSEAIVDIDLNPKPVLEKSKETPMSKRVAQSMGENMKQERFVTPDTSIGEVPDMMAVEYQGKGGTLYKDQDTGEFLFRADDGTENIITGGGNADMPISEFGMKPAEGSYSDKHGTYYVRKIGEGYNVYKVSDDGSLRQVYHGDKANQARKDAIIRKAVDPEWHNNASLLSVMRKKAFELESDLKNVEGNKTASAAIKVELDRLKEKIEIIEAEEAQIENVESMKEAVVESVNKEIEGIDQAAEVVGETGKEALVKEKKQLEEIRDRALGKDVPDEVKAPYDETFEQYFERTKHEGTDSERRYLAEQYAEEVSAMEQSGVEIGSAAKSSIGKVKKFLSRNPSEERTDIRVDDRVIVKGKNGNPDFEATFRGKDSDGMAVVFGTRESGHGQIKVPMEDVSLKRDKAAEPAPEPVAKKAEPEKPVVKSESDKPSNVVEKPIESISTDESRFQNREQLNEERVREISENYDPNQMDPVVVWKDPKDGKTYLLAGHHRLAGAKGAGRKTIPSREFEGTEKQAIEYAKELSNANRTMETPLERASIYRKKRAEGVSEKEIQESLQIEGNNKKIIDDYSHLNPKGRTATTLKSVTSSKTKSAENTGPIEAIAQWIGRVRKLLPELTDAHENEMFEYLFDKGRYGTKTESGKITNMTQFIDLVNKRVSEVTGFNPEEPLNFEHRVGKSAIQLDAESELKEYRAQLADVNERMKKARSAEAKTPEERSAKTAMMKKLSDEFIAVNEKIGQAEKRVKDASKDESQIDIFQQLENQGATDEQVKKFASRSDNEVEVDEAAIKDLERKGELAENLSDAELIAAVESAERFLGEQPEPPVKSGNKEIGGEKKGSEKVEVSDKQIRDEFGDDAFSIMKKAEDNGVPVDRSRVAKTARKIASLDGSEKVKTEHFAEAVQYESAYADNFSDVKKVVEKGGYVNNIGMVERMVKAGVEIPQELFDLLVKAKNEDIVLTATRGLKNTYSGRTDIRFTEANKNTGITREEWNEAKESLTRKGFLDKKGAITENGVLRIGRNITISYDILKIQRPIEKPVAEKPVAEKPSADTSYRDFILDKLDEAHKGRFNGEPINREALIKAWEKTASERSVDKANSDLEGTLLSYSPESTRAGVMQMLRDQFAKGKQAEPSAMEKFQEVQARAAMAEVANELVGIESKLSQKNIEISPDYDNEILVQDKRTGEIIEPEQIPAELRADVARYEEAVRQAGEYDIRMFEEELAKARGEEVDAEVVEPKAIGEGAGEPISELDYDLINPGSKFKLNNGDVFEVVSHKDGITTFKNEKGVEFKFNLSNAAKFFNEEGAVKVRKSLEEIHKSADKDIEQAQKELDAIAKERQNFIKTHGYPSGGDPAFDRIINRKAEAEAKLNEAQRRKDMLLPLEGKGAEKPSVQEPVKFERDEEKRQGLLKDIDDILKDLGKNTFTGGPVLALVEVVGKLASYGYHKIADMAKFLIEKGMNHLLPYLKEAYRKFKNEGSHDAEVRTSLSSEAEIEAFSHEKPLVAKNNPPRPPIKIVSQEMLPKLRNEPVAEGKYDIDETQRFGVNMAMSRFGNGDKAFFLADGAGVGKTRQLLAIARESADKTGKPSLFITLKQVLEDSVENDAKAMNLDRRNIEFGTYDDLRSGKVGQGDYGVVIFDEAHNMKNVQSARSIAGSKVKSDHILYSSATPMDKPEHAVYFLANLTGKEPKDIERELGIEFKYYPDKKNPGEVIGVPSFIGGYDTYLERLKDMRDQIVKDGGMLRRFYPFHGEIAETKIPMPESVKGDIGKVEQIFNDRKDNAETIVIGVWAGEMSRFQGGSFLDNYKKIANGIKSNPEGPYAMEYDRRYRDFLKNEGRKKLDAIDKIVEPGKEEYVYNQAKRAISEGKKVVIVVGDVGKQTVKAGSLQKDGKTPHPKWGYFEKEITETLPVLLKKRFAAEGISVAEIYGGNKSVKGESRYKTEQDRFNKGDADVVIMTAKSGGTGINLDDVVGDKPRKMIIATMDYQGDVFEQTIGRISRRNSASPSQIEIPFMDGAYSDSNRSKKSSRKIAVLRAINAGKADADFDRLKTDHLLKDDMDGEVIESVGEEVAAREQRKQELRDQASQNLRELGKIGARSNMFALGVDGMDKLVKIIDAYVRLGVMNLEDMAADLVKRGYGRYTKFLEEGYNEYVNRTKGVAIDQNGVPINLKPSTGFNPGKVIERERAILEAQADKEIAEGQAAIDGFIQAASAPAKKSVLRSTRRGITSAVKAVGYVPRLPLWVADYLQSKWTGGVVKPIREAAKERLEMVNINPDPQGAAQEIGKAITGLVQGWTGGAKSSDRIAMLEKTVHGQKEYAREQAYRVMTKAHHFFGINKEAAQKVHKVMDPEMYRIVDPAEREAELRRVFGNEKIDALIQADSGFLQKEYADYKARVEARQGPGPLPTEADLTLNEKAFMFLMKEMSKVIHASNFKAGMHSDNYVNNRGKYVPRLYWQHENVLEQQAADAVNRTNLHDIVRLREEIDDWKRENIIDDPSYLMAKRYVQAGRNKAVSDMADYYAKEYAGSIIDQSTIGGGQPPKGHILMPARGYGKLSGKYVPLSIYEDFKGFHFINKKMDALYQAAKAYDSWGVNVALKKLLTAYKPSTRLKNQAQNYVFALMNNIDPVTFYALRNEARRELKEFSPLVQKVIQSGLTSSDLTQIDFQDRLLEHEGLIQDFSASPNPFKNAKDYVVKNGSDILRYLEKTYRMEDDISKIAAMKGLLNNKVPFDEAVRRVANSFQNSKRVPKNIDVIARSPFMSRFTRWKSDFTRILTSNMAERPMTMAAITAGLGGISTMLSKMSGETDDERKLREERAGANVIPLSVFTGDKDDDISMNWKFGGGELDAAGWFAPIYTGNSMDQSDEISLFNKFSPIPYVSLNERSTHPSGPVAELIGKWVQDPFLGPFVSLFADSDFKGSSIIQPEARSYNEGYKGRPESHEFRNRVEYLAKAFIPFGNDAINLWDAATKEPGSDRQLQKGYTLTKEQAVARLFGVKIQQIKDPEYKRFAEKRIKSLAAQFVTQGSKLRQLRKDDTHYGIENSVTLETAKNTLDEMSRILDEVHGLESALKTEEYKEFMEQTLDEYNGYRQEVSKMLYMTERPELIQDMLDQERSIPMGRPSTSRGRSGRRTPRRGR